MDTGQYLSMFLDETKENLRIFNDNLLELEQEANDLNKIAEIFRVAHTIKGMAATMGFSVMAELTHKMEDVLSKVRERKLDISEDVVTTLFKCLDILEHMVECIESGESDDIDILKTIKLLDKYSIIYDERGIKKESKNLKQDMDLNEYDINIIKQAHDCGFNTFDIKIILKENTLLKSARVFLMFQELESLGEIIKSNPCVQDIEDENFEFEVRIVLVTQTPKNEVIKLVAKFSEMESYDISLVCLDRIKNKEVETKRIEKVNASAKIESKSIEVKSKKNKSTHQSVRVDLERLDNLINMVSELVIHRTRLEQIALEENNAELTETLEQVARTTSDLQDLVMKIRMLPLDVVFNRFPRMIRDVSVELGKEVNFIIEGKETELDRTVIDEIGEPLIHLLRNAIDHGIESREERLKQGKSPIGTINLIAYQEGTKAVIKVQDDGAGISLAKIKSRAEKLGMVINNLDENEILNLIFASGFSTNDEVTDISGRGVGMDVVKTKIAALGGSVDVISEEGKGSIFLIRLPLTLQIIQALLVKVGEENFAISLGFIDRVIDFSNIEIKKTNNKEVIIYRDKIIPLVRLDKYFNINSNKDSKKFVVIIKVGDKEVGLLVDNLLGQQEVVIKPLGNSLANIKEYIGATILGNGLVTLILDVGAFV